MVSCKRRGFDEQERKFIIEEALISVFVHQYPFLFPSIVESVILPFVTKLL